MIERDVGEGGDGKNNDNIYTRLARKYTVI